MTRALLITNPAAARTDARAVTAVRETLAGGGWHVEVAATMAPGDARRLAATARVEGFDAILCYGGDGTVMQAAAAVAGTPIPLGIVPGGTGNLLAGNLRLPRTPQGAARALLHAVPYTIDLGSVERADGVHYFAVCCGDGFDAALMARTHGAAKRRWRRAAYVAQALSALPHVMSHRHRVTIDGVAHELDAAMVLVCNCGELVPPFVRLHRDIWPNDGVFDVLAVRAEGTIQSLMAFVEILLAQGPGRVGQLWFGRGSQVQLEVLDGPAQPTQLDGEVVGETPLEARLLPHALTILVDPDTVPGGTGLHG
ncbi:MAG TPA: diacylglycerol kinase family protein [Gemmatimonadales bacterium]|nr:diacylglycerol kinase family protein [Gemmatimonadales bacterium]